MGKYIPIKEIHKLLYHINTLNQEQRRVVEEALTNLRSDGISRREFELLLRNLRAEYKISEIDRSALLEAFAPYFE
jgi:hypothetical protein